MRLPILVFDGGLRAYLSRGAAERALAPAGPRTLDAYDASGRPLELVDRGRGLWGLFGGRGLRLTARAGTSDDRRQLRRRLAETLIQQGAARRWAEGAPLGALVAEAARRLRG